MLALRLGDELHLVTDQPAPTAGPGEALVRVRSAGICGTDLELVRGYKQFDGTPGHEFVGRVERADSAPELVGRRVVGEVNATCGTCATCRAGRSSHCPDRTALGIFGRDGAFAEYLVLPVRNLHVVPDEVADDEAVFTEPVAAACRVLEQVEVGSGDRVVVIGDGRLGQLCAQVLATTGAAVTAIGRHDRKLAGLRRLGIDTATDPELVAAGADLVVEATGSRGGLTTALGLVRAAGTVVLKSTVAAAEHDPAFDWTDVVVREIRVMGSRCGPFDRALELLRTGAVDVSSLIDARYPLDRALEAFEHAGRRGTMKVLIDVPDEGTTVV